MKVAVPCWGSSVAPCIGHCATMAIYTIEHGQVTRRVEVPLRSEDPFDRVRLLRELQVEMVICGGVQDVIEESLTAHGIRVISWVSGSVEGLIRLFLAGQLAGPDIPSPSAN